MEMRNAAIKNPEKFDKEELRDNDYFCSSYLIGEQSRNAYPLTIMKMIEALKNFKLQQKMIKKHINVWMVNYICSVPRLLWRWMKA